LALKSAPNGEAQWKKFKKYYDDNRDPKYNSYNDTNCLIFQRNIWLT